MFGFRSTILFFSVISSLSPFLLSFGLLNMSFYYSIFTYLLFLAVSLYRFSCGCCRDFNIHIELFTLLRFRILPPQVKYGNLAIIQNFLFPILYSCHILYLHALKSPYRWHYTVCFQPSHIKNSVVYSVYHIISLLFHLLCSKISYWYNFHYV